MLKFWKAYLGILYSLVPYCLYVNVENLKKWNLTKLFKKVTFSLGIYMLFVVTNCVMYFL